MLDTNNSQFKKFNVTRELLEILNKETDKMLGVRRKMLQCIIEFDSFEMCYSNDKDRAKANVADIQKLVKLKDTVTKYENYLSQERSQKIKESNDKLEQISNSKIKFIKLREQFSALFSIDNPQERGKKLEAALNNIFNYFKISVKEDFTIFDEEIGKNYEQIDGVIEVNHYLTLLEMKWEKVPIGADKIARFMSRLLVRKNVDGIVISYSSFAETAVVTAKEALAISVLALVDLKDIYDILCQEKDLPTYFTLLIQKVKLYKNPKPVVNTTELPDINFQQYNITAVMNSD